MSACWRLSRGSVRRPSALCERRGQVVVEMLLILPVFMLMLFLIMELGGLAYQTIVANHAAYELARIGSLLAGPGGGERGSADVGRAMAGMERALNDMFPGRSDVKLLSPEIETNRDDPQDSEHKNQDLVVKLLFPARLVFPGTGIFLEKPRGSGKRDITAVVRMPIEIPRFE